MALDNSLRSAGLSLQHFKPGAANVLGALAESEVRYLVALPENMQVEGSSMFRACIYNNTTDSTKVELPCDVVNGKINAPALHKAIDEGAIGLPTVNWLDCYVKVRGTSQEDKWHRYFNDMKAGLLSAGLWAVVCERTVVYNMMTAPYGNHGFFSEISGAASEYFNTRDHTCPLYRALYEDCLFCFSKE